MKTIDKIRDFIAKGETEKAVELLVQFTKEQKPNLQNDAVLLSSRYQQWKRNVTIGINESSNDLRHIENGILTLLENTTVEKSASTAHTATTTTVPTTPVKPSGSAPQKTSNLMPIVIGLLGLGALIMSGFWMFGGDHADDHAHDTTTTTVTQPAGTNTESKPENSKPAKKTIDTKTIDTKKIAEAKDLVVNKLPNTAINNNIIQQPLSKKIPKINGKNVNLIEVNAGFYYRHMGNKKWLETNKKTFKNKNNFVETGRDDYSVYLYDKAREVKMQIDLHRNVMTYADRNTKKRDQYTVVKAMEKVKGMEVIKVEYATGHFMLKEGKTWIEKNKESSDTFTETGRDEWSVYLTNEQKDIQLDLNLKKVMYNEKGKTLAPLYNITKAY